MSSDHNNPIANAIDFVSHGQKLTTNGMIENPFSITQTGQGTNPADSSNLALSGFSLQSDMLTSAYFNSEVGDLRETLAAYQIKVEKNKNGCKRRAIFLGGMNHRDGCSKVCVDVNVGNYPEDVLDHPSLKPYGRGPKLEHPDTNNGLSWKEGKGIPNMILKGNTFKPDMPLYPITKQNPDLYNDSDAYLGSIAGNEYLKDILPSFQNVSSYYDMIQLLETTFGLSSLNSNLTNLGVNATTGIGNKFEKANLNDPNDGGGWTNSITELDCPTYVSLTSAVTQWVRVRAISITVDKVCYLTPKDGDTAADDDRVKVNGLRLKKGGNDLGITWLNGVTVKLIIDGDYCPRQMIGNGMSHQQLFVWTESNTGKGSSNSSAITIDTVNSLFQFDLSNYLVDLPALKADDTSIQLTKDAADHKKISFTGPASASYKKDDYYIISGGKLGRSFSVKLAADGAHVAVGNDGNGKWTLTLTEGFSGDSSNTTDESSKYYMRKYTSDQLLKMVCGFKRFNIDEIRDRYSMLQLIAHIGRIYGTATGLSIPLKLVEYMSQVKSTNSLSNLLHYVSLCELFNYGTSSSVDIGKRLNQIFDFIQEDTNYYSYKEGGNYGIALRYWDDEKDCVETGEKARFTCLNTNIMSGMLTKYLSTTPNAQGNYAATSVSVSDAEQIKRGGKGKDLPLKKGSYTLRTNKVKHIVVTNLPGFNNGRYGSTMSSSNLINGFFGSLSIDLSYSDTHTPVDINGMTVHQWNLTDSQQDDAMFNGKDNPARWNVNADEDYIKLTTTASNCK